MRKNPYNKDLKDQLPLFMQGPSTTIALVANEAQKAIVEKSMVPPLHKYEVGGSAFTKDVAFIMVQPPILNRNGSMNSQDLRNIEMGQTEVTQELFEAVRGWNYSIARGLKNPVEYITWFDCIAFCNSLSNRLGFQPCYEMEGIRRDWDSDRSERIVSARVTWDEAVNGFRLPTEHEWKSFAKAGTQNAWSGTNLKSELGKYAWYEANSGDETNPVGEKLPNEWGLYDMAGNVEEWCWDKLYESNDEDMRVLLGGSFRYIADFCRVTDRDGGLACDPRSSRGFRICRTIK